jgi:hypothetical protein
MFSDIRPDFEVVKEGGILDISQPVLLSVGSELCIGWWSLPP